MKTKRTTAAWVAVLCSLVLVGGAAAFASSPASAKPGINWGQIWKHKLQPKADKRYYKKSQVYSKAQSDGKYAAAGSSYSKAESDGKYAATGSSYSKAQSDAKYAPFPSVIRGTYSISATPTPASSCRRASPGVCRSPRLRRCTSSTWAPLSLSAAPARHWLPTQPQETCACSSPSPATPPRAESSTRQRQAGRSRRPRSSARAYLRPPSPREGSRTMAAGQCARSPFRPTRSLCPRPRGQAPLAESRHDGRRSPPAAVVAFSGRGSTR